MNVLNKLRNVMLAYSQQTVYLWRQPLKAVGAEGVVQLLGARCPPLPQLASKLK